MQGCRLAQKEKRMKEIISGKSLVKTFGQGQEKRRVLDEVNISVEEGEFLSIMGPSGSGKSTLLYACSGMDGVDGGTIAFCGKELSSFREKELADLRRTQMGFVFQQPSLLKNLNILDNIVFPSLRDRRKNTREIVERAKVLMERTGISGLEKRKITQVSGGQLQRAGICRALMNRPEIVFGDEPTGALNSKASEEIMDLFTEINEQGTAVMLVTHDAKIAARTRRVLFLSDGRVAGELELPKAGGLSRAAKMNKVMEKMHLLGL